MTDRTLARLAWSVCAVTLLALASALLLILLSWSSPLPPGETPWQDQAVSLVGVIGAPVLGSLITSRRPRNPYGWVWLGFGMALALWQFAAAYAAYELAEPGTLVAPLTVSRVLGLGNQVALGLAPFLLLLFPNGRLPSQRWRPVAWISVLSGAVLLVLVFLFDNPDKAGGVVGIMAGSVVLFIFATFALSALSLLFRYRNARGVERQQLKWFAFAAVLSASLLVGQTLMWWVAVPVAYFLGGPPLTLDPSLENLLNTAFTMFLYAAVGIAILRHRLYDIDRIINRTLVYGSLTLLLALVYFGGVISLQGLLRALTGQGSQLAIVATTLAIAALFNPLRRRIQEYIDRRFYRSRYDAARTLEAFGARLRDEVDLEDLSGELVGVVRGTMRPTHISLWLREPDRGGTQ